jgi:outer membrane lipoprotein-sorting protein
MNRLALAVLLSTGVCFAAESLDAVLSRMDQGAAQFHSMSADIRMVTHTAILDDNTIENGTLKMQRVKNDAQALIDFTGDKDRRTIAFMNKAIQLYFPKLNLVQVYKLGKKANLLDQYLLLGFGTSGKELVKGYAVNAAGSEQVNGKEATKLELIPKDSKVKEQLDKVEIWIPTDSGYPVQQKFYNPSGNHRLVTYTNFQLNPSLGSLKLETPPNAKIEYPQ